MFIAPRIITKKKPPVLAIVPTEACFEFMCLLHVGARVDISHHAVSVIRVKEQDRIGKSLPFLQSKPKEIQRWAVGKNPFTVWAEYGDKLRR